MDNENELVYMTLMEISDLWMNAGIAFGLMYIK